MRLVQIPEGAGGPLRELLSIHCRPSITGGGNHRGDAQVLLDAGDLGERGRPLRHVHRPVLPRPLVDIAEQVLVQGFQVRRVERPRDRDCAVLDLLLPHVDQAVLDLLKLVLIPDPQPVAKDIASRPEIGVPIPDTIDAHTAVRADPVTR